MEKTWPEKKTLTNQLSKYLKKHQSRKDSKLFKLRTIGPIVDQICNKYFSN